jgi:type IV secretory pathway TrbD component
MSTRVATSVRLGDVRSALTQSLVVLLIPFGLIYVGHELVDPTKARLAIAGGVMAVLVGIGIRSPRALLYGLVVWLAALGLVRRLAADLGPVPQSDPLLVVEAAAIGILLVVAGARGAFNNLSGLAKSVLALSLLILLAAVNPIGGSLTAGFGSLFLILVPLLAFWIGRGLCDDRMLATVLRLVCVLAIVAAVYGLLQTFNGFPSWDAKWISDSGYSALNVGGVLRAFGPFSSASEYAGFLGIGFVALLAFGLRLVRAPVALVALALLAVAIFYESSRGIIFTLSFTAALMVAAWRRLPIAVSVVLAAAAFVSVPFVTRTVASPSPITPQGTGAVLTAHQVQGLSSPFNSKTSTLGAHLSLLGSGFRTALHNPVGLGIGSVTIAGSKYGGQTASTEVDPGNAARALGFPGLIAYLVVVAAAFLRAYSLATRRRDALSLAALGILTVTALQWLNGGQYAVAFLVWFVVGWVDRAEPSIRAGPPGPVAARAGRG